MSSVQPLLLTSGAVGDGDTEEFGVIPEAEGVVPPPTLPPHHATRRDRSGANASGQRQIKPRNIRTALKKLWLDEMLLTKQILCPVPGCTMIFQTLQAIQTHYQFCTGLNESGIVRCEYCGEQFLSQSLALEIHTAEEHRQDRLMSMSKTDDQIAVAIKNEPHNSQQLSHQQSSYNSSSAKMKKFREPSELISIPATPPPDVMIESRRRSVAFSRNQEELIDCEELEGVVRFPLRNLPKGEPEDPLQLPAVMMNLDINLKPRPLSFDDLDENSLMDDALLLAGPLKLKSEPLDKAEDDPHYLSDVINQMPEPDLKTVPPVRKRPRPQQQHISGPDVRVVQVIMRSNSSEPNAAQSILRDPQFVDAIVQQTMGSIVHSGGAQHGAGTPRRKRRKTSQLQQQQPLVVVAFNEPSQEPTSSVVASVPQSAAITSMPPPVLAPPLRMQPQPNIMKKSARNRKQVFPPAVQPTGLVQVTSSLDPGHKFLQTHTLAPGDKPQVRQEVIDSFFNSAIVAATTTSGSSTTVPTTAITCQQLTASTSTCTASPQVITTVVPSQPSTSFVEDSSQLVQQQSNIQPAIVHQHQPQPIPHQHQHMQQVQHSHVMTTVHGGGVQETFQQQQQQQQQTTHHVVHQAHTQQQQQHHHQIVQHQQPQQQQQQQHQIVQQVEEFAQMQVVNSDMLSQISDQGCLIVPQEAFGQLEGAQLIVHEGQIIVQNKNGERLEGCQVVYSNAAFATEATLTVATQEDFSGSQQAGALQQLQAAEVVGTLQLAQDQQHQVVVQQQDHHHHHHHHQQEQQQQHHHQEQQHHHQHVHSEHVQSQPEQAQEQVQQQTQQLVVAADDGGGGSVVITQVDSPLAQVVTHAVAGDTGNHLSGAGAMASLVMSGQLQVIPVGPDDGREQQADKSGQETQQQQQQQQQPAGDESLASIPEPTDAVQISIISMKDPDEAVAPHKVHEVHEQGPIDQLQQHASSVEELQETQSVVVVRHESCTSVHDAGHEEQQQQHRLSQPESLEVLQNVVVQGGEMVCGAAHEIDDKKDADTTATQAAEALLTLRPQNHCTLPTSPLQLPEELQLLHRSVDGAIADAVVVKSGPTDQEASCEDDEVFQMIPEPQTPPDEGEQICTTLDRQDGTERPEVPGGGENGHNVHMEMPSSVELAVHPARTTTATASSSGETDSDLVVVEAEKYSSVRA